MTRYGTHRSGGRFTGSRTFAPVGNCPNESSFFDDFAEGTPGQPLESPWYNSGYGPRYTDPPGATSETFGSSASTHIPALAECCDIVGQTIIIEGEWGEQNYGYIYEAPYITYNNGVEGGFMAYMHYSSHYESLRFGFLGNTYGADLGGARPHGSYVPASGDPLTMSLSVTPTEITLTYEFDDNSLVGSVTVTPTPNMVAAQRLGFSLYRPYTGTSPVLRSFTAECGSLPAGTDAGSFGWDGP